MSDYATTRTDDTIKPHMIVEERNRYAPFIETFVETGTAGGDTAEAVAPYFEQVYTIELGLDPYLNNVLRWRHQPKLHQIYGDSDVVLPRVLDAIAAPALFWLDAHYCGGTRGPVDTPVRRELEHIVSRNRPHFIMVDDARLFGVDPEYPTIEWVRQFVNNFRPYDVVVADDIIRIRPVGERRNG